MRLALRAAAVAAVALLAVPTGAEADRPRITGLRVVANSPTDPVVRAIINPGGATTTWHVEYGPTEALGASTPAAELPAGTDDVVVTAVLAGVETRRRVWWRVVATNEDGTRRSRRARFTTERAPSGVTLQIDPLVVPWGQPVVARGLVLGEGVAGITVAFQRLPFPFSGPFSDVATAAADDAGGFVFDAGPLLVTTRFLVQTRTPVLAQSDVVTVSSQLVVDLRVGEPTRRRAPVSGAVRPPVPNGRAFLQRLRLDGTWASVDEARLADRFTHSTYAFDIARVRRAAVYRVGVDARDGGAHVPGVSSTIRVRALPPRRRPPRRRPKPSAGPSGSISVRAAAPRALSRRPPL
jgi:hypothetical protein